MEDPFGVAQFIIRKTELMYLWGLMELDLAAHKDDNWDLQKRIDLLKQHYVFLNELQREYETIVRVNKDYVHENLSLITQNKSLKGQLEF
jgi:hypothetical protein